MGLECVIAPAQQQLPFQCTKSKVFLLVLPHPALVGFMTFCIFYAHLSFLPCSCLEPLTVTFINLYRILHG